MQLNIHAISYLFITKNYDNDVKKVHRHAQHTTIYIVVIVRVGTVVYCHVLFGRKNMLLTSSCLAGSFSNCFYHVSSSDILKFSYFSSSSKTFSVS